MNETFIHGGIGVAGTRACCPSLGFAFRGTRRLSFELAFVFRTDEQRTWQATGNPTRMPAQPSQSPLQNG